MNAQALTPENVLVFKTSVKTEADKRNVAAILNSERHIDDWHIDLEDCDKILRVVTGTLNAMHVIDMVNQKGYLCIELT